MLFLVRCILCLALVLVAAPAFGASGAANVQVNVKQGRTKVFTAITDGTGRFTTAPMEPGVYTFELRALKTAPPAQYFLILSGAKPVTPAMADKNAVLMMDAQVRTPRSVTGQVTARRLRIMAPAGTTPATNQPPALSMAPTPAATPTAVLSRSQAIATSRTAVPARVTVPARIVAGPRAATAAPAAGPAASTRVVAPARAAAPATVATAATPATARPVAAPRVARPAAVLTTAAPAQGVARPAAPARAAMTQPRAATPAPQETSGITSRPPGAQTRVINGRTHVWVPIAPGSTLGRWVPGRQ